MDVWHSRAVVIQSGPRCGVYASSPLSFCTPLVITAALSAFPPAVSTGAFQIRIRICFGIYLWLAVYPKFGPTRKTTADSLQAHIFGTLNKLTFFTPDDPSFFDDGHFQNRRRETIAFLTASLMTLWPSVVLFSLLIRTADCVSQSRKW